LRRGPTIQTKMSLATSRIYSTISPPLSGALEDCSIVRVQQLQMLLSPKMLYVCVSTHVRLCCDAVDRLHAGIDTKYSYIEYLLSLLRAWWM